MREELGIPVSIVVNVYHLLSVLNLYLKISRIVVVLQPQFFVLQIDKETSRRAGQTSPRFFLLLWLETRMLSYFVGECPPYFSPLLQIEMD